MPTPPPLPPSPSPSAAISPCPEDDATWTTGQAEQQLSRRRSSSHDTTTTTTTTATPMPCMASFTTLDDALNSLSISPSASALALDTARASLEQASPAPSLSRPPRASYCPDSYYGEDYQRLRRQRGSCRRMSSVGPHARLDGEDDAGRVLLLRAAGSGHRVLPSRPPQCQHQFTAPALLQTQRLPSSKRKGGEAEEEEDEAQDMIASPQPQRPTGDDTSAALEEQQQQQLDYCDVVASSDHGSRPSYATLTFSSFSSASSSSSTISSSATDSSSGSSSTVTAGTGFSTTPGIAAAGVVGVAGRRASAPAAPTLSSSSWSSFCPLLARVPSYNEGTPPPLPESPGAAPDTLGPMHLQLPGSGGVGSRRAYTPSPLTPFPHHSSYFRPSMSASSSSSMRSPSPYAHVTRRESAMETACSPASSSRGRDYMNPDTPPRTPPAAAALMMAALERRRSESAAVMARKGLGSGSCSPVSGTRRLAPQCASCGRCKPEKSRYCCGWPPVHMVLFHGPSGRGWADEGKGKSSRASRRSRVVTGGM